MVWSGAAAVNKDDEIDAALKRVQCQRGVDGVMLVNGDNGVPVKSTPDDSTAERYGGPVQQLADTARDVVRSLDASDDLTLFRMRTDKYEMIAAPAGNNFTMIAIQNVRTEAQPQS